MGINLTQLRYAVEVEKTRSISKAAERLYMGQPNVSRAIRELEESIGITIFNRSSRGISPTPEGEIFLSYAKDIIDKVNDIEAHYSAPGERKKRFCISVPRAGYITQAFSELVEQGELNGIEVHFKETNAGHAISNITDDDYNMAIVRFMSEYNDKFEDMIKEKGLRYENLWEYERVVLMSKKNLLSQSEVFSQSMLSVMYEVYHNDYYTPPLTISSEKGATPTNRLYIFERASRLELLSNTDNTYMWSSPEPKEMLERYGLKALRSDSPVKKYKDVLVYKKNYRFTSVDERFLEILRAVKRKTE